MTYLSPYRNRLNALRFPEALGDLDRHLSSLFAELPSLFDVEGGEALGVSSGAVRTRWYENGEAFLARLDLPGVRKGDIALELEDGLLTVTAKRTFEAEDKEAENAFTYRKTLEIPDDTQDDKIAAAYEDGVLSLTFPKGEKAKPRKIEVNFGNLS